MTEAQLRIEICRIGRSLFDRGYAHSTAGNISVRLADGAGWLITPTDACLGFLQPARLAHVGADGELVSGDSASKTLALHRRIYEADAEASCVIHTHSTHAVALSMGGAWRTDELLPPITPYFVMKVGHVPLIHYHRPGDVAAADAVAVAINRARKRGTPVRAVVLERLGPIVWHESLEAAMATLEELEETARLWLMLNPRPSPLNENRIDDLRRHFGARW